MNIPKKVIAPSLLIALLVIVCQTISFAEENTAGIDNFNRVKTYASGQFSDVPTSAWFADNVVTAYELGLMKGSSNTFFNASGNVSIAEAITMASRIYSIYMTGTENFEQSVPWYKNYVEYALKNSIIENGYTDYTKKATYAEFVKILSGALPSEALASINKVDDGMIPGVQLGVTYASAVYRLYRAGILTGNDSIGTFTPNSNIGRNAAAAILTRLAIPSLRKSITFRGPATAILLNNTTLSLGIGFSKTLNVNFTPSDTTDRRITWTSSNTKVASISAEGKVTGVAIGTAVITAKSTNGKTAICNVTVAQLGTITNPLPGNNNTTIEFGTKKVIITVKEVYTGEAAYNIINSQHTLLNDAPPRVPTPSQEWRVFIFNIKYISGRNDTDVLNVSDVISDFYTYPGNQLPIFSYANFGHNYSEYNSQIRSYIEKTIVVGAYADINDIKLYQGASSEAAIGILTDKNAGDALLRVMYSGEGKITWISCTMGTE